VAAWFASGWAVDFLIEHTVPADVPVIFLSPAEAFATRLKVAVAVAILVTLPYISWRIWQFIVPGLYARERTLLVSLSAFSTALFYIGAVVSFLLVVPIVVRILLAFGTGNLVPQIAVGALLGFVLRLCLACGLVFQMPLVIAVLTHLGLLTPKWLIARWRWALR